MSKLPRNKMLAILAVLIFVGAVVVIMFVRESSPYLKKRAIELLSEKLNGEVELDKFEASAFPSLQVHGSGLIVRYQGRTDVPPLISIREFTARAGPFGLLGKPWKVDYLELKGMTITVPHRGDKPRDTSTYKHKDIPLLIHELVADDAQLILLPKSADKSPHVFEIHSLLMHHVGLHRAASFEAELTNPKPPGEIDSQGSFGPWNADEPALTPLSATYKFSHADLSVFKGISGILSSHGKFGGVLDRIEVDGETETPDFIVTSGGHPVALHTQFSATVDGLTGDTLLHPVNAQFLNSSVVANGKVVETPDKKGRDINLDVTVEKARIEDMLALAVKTKPLMAGPVKFRTKFDLPPGEGDVADRLKLNGQFIIQHAEFTAPEVREKLEALSRKAQGKPGDQDEGSSVATLRGNFTLDNRIITLRQARFAVPGASFAFDGTYTLQNEALEFHGTLRMDAKLSQTMSGYKSILLRPFDPFFRKNQGTQLPIKISGTRNDPSFGLDFHRKEEGH
jgi:hypothetical protein